MAQPAGAAVLSRRPVAIPTVQRDACNWSCLRCCTHPCCHSYAAPAKPQDVRLLITVPRLPMAVSEVTPDPLEEAFRLLMRLRVSLRDAWVRADVRVTLRPLLRRLPVVGALQGGCFECLGVGQLAPQAC